MKNSSGSRKCTATPQPTPKTDGGAPRAFETPRRSTALPMADTLSQSSSGSTGSPKPTSQPSDPKRPYRQQFPIPTQGGLCVVNPFFPGATTFEAMNPQPISPTPSLSPEEAPPINRSGSAFAPKETSGPTIKGKPESIGIWIEPSAGPGPSSNPPDMAAVPLFPSTLPHARGASPPARSFPRHTVEIPCTFHQWSRIIRSEKSD